MILFGTSVTISGDTAIVGAPIMTPPASNAGPAYVLLTKFCKEDQWLVTDL